VEDRLLAASDQKSNNRRMEQDEISSLCTSIEGSSRGEANPDDNSESLTWSSAVVTAEFLYSQGGCVQSVLIP
jgi:hypothetical protein